ncbi:recombination regulator RecX [Bacillus sp. FJAT-47783]|uniref:recombination regulator RecX n=1 Tax=Bacillus sp. FJAT-47783 TaxID=2922712 RepID=UPI001FACD804|nr:recombination regulator RecX [Bacillus sp. FJAT-47783]
MYITKIEVQKNNSDRFNIFVNKGKGEEYGFSVHKDTLVKFGLRKGLELDDIELIEIQFGDETKKAYNSAIEYLGFKMRTEQEVRRHLRKKEVGEHIVDDVIKQLTGQNYVNDEEYASLYVRTQIRSNKKGPIVIQKELEEKGVKPSYIKAALKQFTKEMQIDIAYKLAGKFQSKTERLSFIQLKQKIEETLIRRGFSFEIIQTVLEMMPVEQSSDEEWGALIKQAEKAMKRYDRFDGYTKKQKLKQSLFRKGFSIELIERYIDEIE